MTNYFPKQSVKSKKSLLSSIHKLYLSWAAKTCNLGQNVERGSRWESLVKMFLWQHTSSSITYEFTVGIFWWSGNWMYYLIIGQLVKFYLWQLTSSKITQEVAMGTWPFKHFWLWWCYQNNFKGSVSTLWNSI